MLWNKKASSLGIHRRVVLIYLFILETAVFLSPFLIVSESPASLSLCSFVLFKTPKNSVARGGTCRPEPDPNPNRAGPAWHGPIWVRPSVRQLSTPVAAERTRLTSTCATAPVLHQCQEDVKAGVGSSGQLQAWGLALRNWASGSLWTPLCSPLFFSQTSSHLALHDAPSHDLSESCPCPLFYPDTTFSPTLSLPPSLPLNLPLPLSLSFSQNMVITLGVSLWWFCGRVLCNSAWFIMVIT